MSVKAPTTVHVAIDDAAAAATVLALSAALAAELGCELAVVYVESAASVSAAALSVTQVLPHAGSAWLPLVPADVEQGFRSQAARVRELTAQWAGRHSLRWSVRVMRGRLADAPTLLRGDSTLLFVASAPAPGFPVARAAASRRRRPVVALASDDGEPATQTLAAATRLAHALGGLVQRWSDGWPQTSGDAARSVAVRTRPDVLVLTRRDIDPGGLRLLEFPLLLVGG